MHKSAFPNAIKHFQHVTWFEWTTGQEVILDFEVESEVENWFLSVGERLESALIDEDLKHPFLLPSHHHITEQIIQYHHSQVGQLGQESVLSSLRERFCLGFERMFCSALCVREMSRLPEEKIIYQRAVQGQVAQRQNYSTWSYLHMSVSILGLYM